MHSIKNNRIRISALGLALAAAMLTPNLYAGVINNFNADTAPGAFKGDCEALGDLTGCVGALNLNNVNVNLVHLADGTTFGTFDKVTGAYSPMALGDSFVSTIVNTSNEVVAKLTGKVWPIGEPVGIKAVYGDTKVKNGKPQNCLINTAFLSALDSGDATAAYLNTTHPQPVICSSAFQTHKRFKVAMQPATVAGIADGAEGKPIDLVFNVADGDGLQPYEVFSKINNYTGKRLKGYKIVVGQGTGSSFVSASEAGIADKLHISLGIGEGWSSGSAGAADGSDLFHDDGLATFSHGLFGEIDIPKHPTNGFFDTRTAGFNVTQTCAVLPCAVSPNPFVGGADLLESDTIVSTTVLPSNYTTFFGDWLPQTMQPTGIFYDDDNDPSTDDTLTAWWDGKNWRKNNDSGFEIVTEAELLAWHEAGNYVVEKIEDVLNLGINYIVKVGDDLDNDPSTTASEITIRIIPVVADNPLALPDFMDPAEGSTEPAVPGTIPTTPTSPWPTNYSSSGCSTANGNAPFDPLLPMIAAAALAALGLRRRRRQQRHQ